MSQTNRKTLLFFNLISYGSVIPPVALLIEFIDAKNDCGCFFITFNIIFGYHDYSDLIKVPSFNPLRIYLIIIMALS